MEEDRERQTPNLSPEGSRHKAQEGQEEAETQNATEHGEQKQNGRGGAKPRSAKQHGSNAR